MILIAAWTAVPRYPGGLHGAMCGVYLSKAHSQQNQAVGERAKCQHA